MPREIEAVFKKAINSRLIKVISGIRRSGKSVLIYLLLKDKNFAYMNFDDDRISNVNTDDVLSSFYDIYGKDLKYIFLDEVQNLDNWELFVNRLHRAGFNIFITGSNSKLLSKELATHLTGRHLTIELFPFSFREYLKASQFNEDIKTTKGISLLKRELKNYLDLGGFPEIVADSEDPKLYIRNLYSKLIDRDIINRHDISYKRTFKEISIAVLSNPSKPISYNKLKNQFNLGSEHTVKNYLSYLEEAYLIFLIDRFSFKPQEIEKSEKKVYAIDTGIIHSIGLRFSDDIGRIYENVVAIELMRIKARDSDIDIYYWKNTGHEEVDFAVKKGIKVVQLIQVCFNIDNPKTKDREIRALLKAKDETKCDNLLILTEDYEAQEEMEWFGFKGKIKFMPLWKWLIQKNYAY